MLALQQALAVRSDFGERGGQLAVDMQRLFSRALRFSGADEAPHVFVPTGCYRLLCRLLAACPEHQAHAMHTPCARCAHAMHHAPCTMHHAPCTYQLLLADFDWLPPQPSGAVCAPVVQMQRGGVGADLEGDYLMAPRHGHKGPGRPFCLCLLWGCLRWLPTTPGLPRRALSTPGYAAPSAQAAEPPRVHCGAAVRRPGSFTPRAPHTQAPGECDVMFPTHFSSVATLYTALTGRKAVPLSPARTPPPLLPHPMRLTLRASHGAPHLAPLTLRHAPPLNLCPSTLHMQPSTLGP